MTKEQYDKAAVILNRIMVAERKINEAELLYNLCEQDGGFVSYWCNVIKLLWSDEKTKNDLGRSLFSSLVKYKAKMEKEMEKLEKQFNEL